MKLKQAPKDDFDDQLPVTFNSEDDVPEDEENTDFIMLDEKFKVMEDDDSDSPKYSAETKAESKGKSSAETIAEEEEKRRQDSEQREQEEIAERERIR